MGGASEENKERDCISCKRGDIHSLPFLLQNRFAKKFAGMKILVFGTPEEQKKVLDSFCEPCIEYVRVYDKKEVLAKEYHCGDTKLLLSAKKMHEFTATNLEDVKIRISGETEWGKPMRSSGLFSNYVLQRSYGRDSYDFEAKPNAVILFTNKEGEMIDGVREECATRNVVFQALTRVDEKKISETIDTAKMNLISSYIKQWGNDRYEEGKEKARKASKDSYNRGYNEAIKESNKVAKEKYDKGFEDGFVEGQKFERSGAKEYKGSAANHKHSRNKKE